MTFQCPVNPGIPAVYSWRVFSSLEPIAGANLRTQDHQWWSEVVGSVNRTEHTAVRGFRITQSVRQTDRHNAVVVEYTWSGD
jgi:hypothetical protein